MEIKFESSKENYIHGIAYDPRMQLFIDEAGLPNEKFAEQISEVIKTIPNIQENPNVGIVIVSTVKSITIIELEVLVAKCYMPLTQLLSESNIRKNYTDNYVVDLISVVANEWWKNELNSMEEEPKIFDMEKQKCAKPKTQPTNGTSPYIREKMENGQRITFVLKFCKLDNVILMAKLSPKLSATGIDLYKLKGQYYLLVNSIIKEDDEMKRNVFIMQKFVDTGKECGGQFESPHTIAFIREHGEAFCNDIFYKMAEL